MNSQHRGMGRSHAREAALWAGRRHDGSAGMPVRSRVAAVGLIVAVLVASVVTAAWAGTLDQHQTDTSGGAHPVTVTRWLAQTFTAGVTGGLDQVDMYLEGVGSGGQPVTVEIRATDAAGAPSVHVLGATSVPATSIPEFRDWAEVGFDPPVPVEEGTVYAIVAAPEHDTLIWFIGQGDAYEGGSPWIAARPPADTHSTPLSVSDFAFRTYVVTGEACDGEVGVEFDAAVIGGPDPVSRGQQESWTVELEVVACEDVTDVSAQGGSVAWADTTGSSQDGSISVRHLNRRNQVLEWDIGSLAAGDTASATLIVTGTVGAKAVCGSELPLTGQWSATATADQPDAVPTKYDTAGPVTVTIGGDGC